MDDEKSFSTYKKYFRIIEDEDVKQYNIVQCNAQ